MGLALKTFQIFKDNETAAKGLAEIIDSSAQLLKQHEAATKSDVRETELRLIKEIDSIRSATIKWIMGLLFTQTIAIAAFIYTVSAQLR